MKDIENELKEKYDEVEVPSYMFDTSRVFKRVEEEKRQKRKNITRIVASIIVFFIVALILIIIIPNKNENEEYKIIEKSDNNISIKGEISINNSIMKQKTTRISNLLVIRNLKNIEFVIINDIPYTKIKAEVINTYIGSLSGEIEMYVPGGVFSVEEIYKIDGNQDIDLSKYNNEDLLKVTYYNDIYIPVAEENKTYLTTLLEIDGKLLVDIDKEYGFKEYDPETNIVKDDMGDVELEIDKYLENINI